LLDKLNIAYVLSEFWAMGRNKSGSLSPAKSG
jgi:hypothetical protein